MLDSAEYVRSIRACRRVGRYWGTSLMRNTPLLGPCSRAVPRVLLQGPRRGVLPRLLAPRLFGGGYLIHLRVLEYTRRYMTLGRCPLSIFCPLETPLSVEVMNERSVEPTNPTLSLSSVVPTKSYYALTIFSYSSLQGLGRSTSPDDAAFLEPLSRLVRAPCHESWPLPSKKPT